MRISPPRKPTQAKGKGKLAAVRERMALSSLSPSDDDGHNNSSDLGAVESIDLGAAPGGGGSGNSSSTSTGADAGGASDGDGIGEASSVRDDTGSRQGQPSSESEPDRSGANRARGRRRGRSDTGYSPDSGAGERAQAREGSDSEAVPREVEFATLGGPSAKKSHVLSVEFLAEGWCILFQTIGFIVQDKEWEIEKDSDGAELAERTISWFQSLDKKRAGEWEKRIAKWQPLLAVFTALATLVIPRILSTRSKRRAVHVQAPGQATNRTAAPTPAAGTTAAGAPIIDPSVQAASSNGNGKADAARGPSGNGPNSVRFRPVRHQDWGELFGPDV